MPGSSLAQIKRENQEYNRLFGIYDPYKWSEMVTAKVDSVSPGYKQTIAKIASFVPYCIALLADCLRNLSYKISDKISENKARKFVQLLNLPESYIPMVRMLQTLPNELHKNIAVNPYALNRLMGFQRAVTSIAEIYEQDSRFLADFLHDTYEKLIEWHPRTEIYTLLKPRLHRWFRSSKTLRDFLEIPEGAQLKAVFSKDPQERQKLIQDHPEVSPHLIKILPDLLEKEKPRQALLHQIRYEEKLYQIIFQQDPNGQVSVDPNHPQNALLNYVQHPTFEEILENRPSHRGKLDKKFSADLAALKGTLSPDEKIAYLDSHPAFAAELLNFFAQSSFVDFKAGKMLLDDRPCTKEIKIPHSQIKLAFLLEYYLNNLSALETLMKQPKFQEFQTRYKSQLIDFSSSPNREEFLQQHPEFKEGLLNLLSQCHQNGYYLQGFIDEPLKIVLSHAHLFNEMIVKIDTTPGLLQKELDDYPEILNQLENKKPKYIHEIGHEKPALYYEFVSLLAKKYGAYPQIRVLE